MRAIKRIDDYFYSHTKKDLIYAIVGSVVLIGFLFIYFLYPKASSFEKTQQRNFTNAYNSYMQTKTQIRMLQIREARLKNNLKLAKAKMINLKKQKSFYEELTNLLDYARFNQQKWADYVKNLVFDAKKEGLKVLTINNKIINVSEKNRKKLKLKKLPENVIVKKMSIGIKLDGNYKNFIHYIYKYEDTKDLIRVEKIVIGPSSMMKQNIKKSKNKKNIKQTNNKHSKIVYFVKFALYGYEK